MNKSLKKNLIILSAVLSVILLIGMFTVLADESSDIGGTIEGTEITWSLSDGVLTLSGSGETPHHNSGGKPWNSYMSSITEVVVEEGITCLGADAFSYGSALTTVTLPSSLTELKQGVFWACGGISTVYYSGTIDEFKANVTVAVYNDQIYNATWNKLQDSTVTPEIVQVNIVSFEEFNGAGEAYSNPFGSALGGPQNMVDGDPNSVWGWNFEADMGFIAHFDGATYISDIFLQTKDESSMMGDTSPHGIYNIYALVNGNWVEVATTGAYINGINVELDVTTTAIKVTIPEWYNSNWGVVAELGFNGYHLICNNGHDEITHEAKSATCTEIGWAEYVTCSRCAYTTYEEIPATHDLFTHEAKAATCTEVGWAEYVTCSRCEYTTYEEIPAAHDLFTHEAKVATCTEVGWAEYVACSRCEYTTYVEIPSLGGEHDLTTYEAKSETCTEPGWAEYVTCSRCDYTTYVGIPAHGHNWSTYEGREATCRIYGWKEYSTCSRCHDTTYSSIPKKAHRYVDGFCRICNEEEPVPTREENIIIEPFGNTGWENWLNATHLVVVFPTWASAGCSPFYDPDIEGRFRTIDYTSYEWTLTFTWDGGSKTVKQVPSSYFDSMLIRFQTVIEEKENQFIPVNGTAYTVSISCVVGDTLYYGTSEEFVYICSIDPIVPDEYNYVSDCSNGHDEVTHSGKAATCTEAGWAEYVTCSRCDYTTYVEIPALGHDETVHESKNPTCTEAGWAEYVTCSRCDYTTYVKIPALGHDETVHESKNPTCTEAGWAEYVTCSRCEYTTYVEIPATGHNYVDGVCSDCGEEAITVIASGTTGNLTWVLTSDGVLKISGEGSMPDYSYHSMPWYSYLASIREVIIEKGVTSVGRSAFYHCEYLKSITIPESVMSIGGHAFYWCKSLTSVYITDVTKWCSIAFNDFTSNPFYISNGGSLYLNNILITELVIPEGVTSIDDYTFYHCISLTSITIPEGVTSIGDYAFYRCTYLTSINIPESVLSIGNSVFSECKSLTNINVRKNNQAYKSVDGVLFTNDGTTLVCYPAGNLETHYIIPNDVVCIGEGAFANCNSLTSITIPKGVTSIGNNVFSGCTSLTSITIPEGVTSIGNSAFGSCTSLTSITIPEGVTSIGEQTFYYCTSLTSITIPKGVTSIGILAFSWCKSLKSVNIPDGVTSIDDHAFTWCTGLTRVTIPESVTSIGYCAFDDCKSLKYVYITDIAKWCNISFNVTSSNPLFNGGSLYLNDNLVTDLVIPEGVTSIDHFAFKRCSSLTSVTVPESVTSIRSEAFAYCTSLKTVYYYGTQEEWNNIVIGSYNECLLNAEIIFLGEEGKIGFVTDEDGNTMYYYEDGTYAKGWTTIDGKTYYFNTQGILFTGEVKVSGILTYYFGEDHALLEGLMLEEDGYRFYKGGIRQYGWADTNGDGERDSYFYVSSQLRCEEDRVLFDGVDARRFFKYNSETGFMEVVNGFYTNEKGTQFFKNGIGQYGWITADGVSITDKPGITLSDVHYFAYGDGLNFYMVEDAVKTIGGVVREFDENHLAKAYTGWAVNKKTGNENYYVEGVLQQGWCETPDGWVYLSRSENLANNITYGDVTYGWKKIGGKVYYFRAGTSDPKYVVISDPERQLNYNGVRETYYINQPADSETATGADYYITNPPAGL